MKNLITINVVNFKNDLLTNFKRGLLFLILFLWTTMAISQTLFTEKITPENVEGKVFYLKNGLEGKLMNAASNYGGNALHCSNHRSEYSEWALFHVGTDLNDPDNKDDDRYYFALAQYESGLIVNIPGTKPVPHYKKDFTTYGGMGSIFWSMDIGNSMTLAGGWYKNWHEDDRVFYFEKIKGSNNSSYIIRPYYNSDLSLATIPGDLKYIRLDDVDKYNEMAKNVNELNKHSTYYNPPYYSIIGDKGNHWQLIESSTTLKLPTVEKADSNQVVVTTPDWHKNEVPTQQEQNSLFGWKNVGSSKIPYFMVEDSNNDRATAIKNTPYYKLTRQQRWDHVRRYGNWTNTAIDKVELWVVKGWENTQLHSFTASLGIEVSSSYTQEIPEIGGSLSFSQKISSELTWGWSTTTTTSETKTERDIHSIPAFASLHLWQVHERFLAYTYNGDFIGSWILPVEGMEPTISYRYNTPNHLPQNAGLIPQDSGFEMSQAHLTPKGPSQTITPKDGYYNIRTAEQSLIVTSQPFDQHSEGKIKFFNTDKNHQGTAWYIQSSGDNYSIQNSADNYNLNLFDSGVRTDNQFPEKWKLIKTTSGSIYIQSVSDGSFLAKANNGSLITVKDKSKAAEITLNPTKI